MAIGDRIRRARLAAGLSQRELAAAIGVTHGLVGQWESHRKSPGRDNLLRISEATFTDPAAILRDIRKDEIGAVQVSDIRQIAMLRRWVLMSVKQQDSLLEFMGIAADVRRELHKQREPTEA